MYKLYLKNYGGGGHITVAGAQIEEKLSLEEAKKTVIEKINEYLEEN